MGVFGPSKYGLVLRVPDEEESELIVMLSFWPWAITGRGEYPRRTGGNEQGFRDPPGVMACRVQSTLATNFKKCTRWFI